MDRNAALSVNALAHSQLLPLQWLLYNDCIFRTRNLYEYVMFHDRDEFVHFVGFKPKKVDLLSMFNQHFKEKDVAGVTYWGALYHTHCHMEEVRLLSSLLVVYPWQAWLQASQVSQVSQALRVSFAAT